MLFLDRTAKHPLFLQIYEQIKARILSSEMVTGSKLKSIRAFSREYNISHKTVETAYQQLLAEGYIESRPGSGFFVATLDMFLPLPKETKPDDIDCGDVSSDDSRIDFDPANLSPDVFPYKIWRKLIVECYQTCQLSKYNDTQGEAGLRRELQKYLASSRGVSCEPEQIIICPGTAHSLSIVGQILRQSHVAIAMEEPGYYTARSVFANYSFKIAPIAVRTDGVDIQQLIQSRSQVVYVTPSHQFPLGYVMSIANRLKLLQWAEETNGVIIEDDYDSELNYYGQPISALQGLNPKGQIVYLGTFSKSLSPALRVSYMVLPWSLLAQYKKMFKQYQAPVPLLTQDVLEKFMSMGFWERHLRKIRVIYRKKHDDVLSALENTFGDKITIISKGAGLHLPLGISGNRSDIELVETAKALGVRVYPMSVCSSLETPTIGIRLGFGAVPDDDIQNGIHLLHKAWFR